jgi:hypothetical protein
MVEDASKYGRRGWNDFFGLFITIVGFKTIINLITYFSNDAD